MRGTRPRGWNRADDSTRARLWAGEGYFPAASAAQRGRGRAQARDTEGALGALSQK